MFRKNIAKTALYILAILSAIYSAGLVVSSSPDAVINVSAEISTTCVDPVTGKIKNWVVCLSPVSDPECSGGVIIPGQQNCSATGQVDNQTLEEIKKEALINFMKIRVYYL